MNDALLMGVLDRVADRHEQFQALARRQMVVIAIPGDGHAVDQFHDEIRPAGFRGPGVQDAGDVDMVHHCQGLPFGLEAGDDLSGVHAWLDDFQSDLAANRRMLLGHEDDAKAALAELLQQLVRADDRTRAFFQAQAVPLVGCGLGDISLGGIGRWRLQKVAPALVLLQQPFDPLTQDRIAGTRLVEPGRTFGWVFLFQRLGENCLFQHDGRSRSGLPAATPLCDICS